MVFDAFTVGDGSGFANAYGQEKCFHDCVPFVAFAGKCSAFAGQFQRLVRFRGNVAISNKSRDCVIDGRMGHVKKLDKIVCPANRIAVNKLRDRFHIVFRYFRGVIRSSSLVDVCHIEFFAGGQACVA